jgi:hypothetical protein
VARSRGRGSHRRHLQDVWSPAWMLYSVNTARQKRPIEGLDGATKRSFRQPQSRGACFSRSVVQEQRPMRKSVDPFRRQLHVSCRLFSQASI